MNVDNWKPEIGEIVQYEEGRWREGEVVAFHHGAAIIVDCDSPRNVVALKKPLYKPRKTGKEKLQETRKNILLSKVSRYSEGVLGVDGETAEKISEGLTNDGYVIPKDLNDKAVDSLWGRAGGNDSDGRPVVDVFAKLVSSYIKGDIEL